jgi:hypothetical protein
MKVNVLQEDPSTSYRKKHDTSLRMTEKMLRMTVYLQNIFNN